MVGAAMRLREENVSWPLVGVNVFSVFASFMSVASHEDVPWVLSVAGVAVSSGFLGWQLSVMWNRLSKTG